MDNSRPYQNSKSNASLLTSADPTNQLPTVLPVCRNEAECRGAERHIDRTIKVEPRYQDRIVLAHRMGSISGPDVDELQMNEVLYDAIPARSSA
jgi:hypothetical protein